MKLDSAPYHRREILSLGASALCSGSLCKNVLGLNQDNARDPKHGTIILCGGGKLPDSILNRFCELSNPENSSLVLIPTASPRSDAQDFSPWLELWSSRGWRKVHVVHAADQQSALNPDFGKPIQDASAVWIGGGDQSRLAERFNESPLLDRLRELLRRGGVLGGTSAGAAILSKQMIADGIDQPIMAQGFGILPRLIIDQHFSQKNRFRRLSHAVSLHPELTGIGIDESTGLELQQDIAQVIGQGQVHGYQKNNQHVAWSAGDRIDPADWKEMFVYDWENTNDRKSK